MFHNLLKLETYSTTRQRTLNHLTKNIPICTLNIQRHQILPADFFLDKVIAIFRRKWPASGYGVSWGYITILTGRQLGVCFNSYKILIENNLGSHRSKRRCEVLGTSILRIMANIIMLSSDSWAPNTCWKRIYFSLSQKNMQGFSLLLLQIYGTKGFPHCERFLRLMYSFFRKYIKGWRKKRSGVSVCTRKHFLPLAGEWRLGPSRPVTQTESRWGEHISTHSSEEQQRTDFTAILFSICLHTVFRILWKMSSFFSGRLNCITSQILFWSDDNSSCALWEKKIHRLYVCESLRQACSLHFILCEYFWTWYWQGVG